MKRTLNKNKKITDKNKIKKWVEEHGGVPAIIDDRVAQADKIGLKIDFPGKRDEMLLGKSQEVIEIGWQEFFEIFEKQNLSLTLYSEDVSKNPADWYKFEKRS